MAETLPLFPLGTVLLPGATLPLHIFEPRYRQLTLDLVTGAIPDREFGVVAVREGWTPDDDGIEGLHSTGCTAQLRDVKRLPDGRFDIVTAARDRLRAKLSYTNLGFALAPREFTISALRDLYAAALGHPVSATNLQRVLTRRRVLEPTGAVAPPGPAGGRPAALFRFTDRTLRVTDAFAVLRPPGEGSRIAVP